MEFVVFISISYLAQCYTILMQFWFCEVLFQPMVAWHVKMKQSVEEEQLWSLNLDGGIPPLTLQIFMSVLFMKPVSTATV